MNISFSSKFGEKAAYVNMAENRWGVVEMRGWGWDDSESSDWGEERDIQRREKRA